jgi:hypothetical protein
MNSFRSFRLISIGMAASVLLLLPIAVCAGTLCGTVRDLSTGSVVARAGIFLRTTGGDYTGLYGATDSAGFFCIDPVPAGLYDIEVRVDNYMVAYTRNVEVTEAPTSVDIDLTNSRFLFAPPRPNPGKDHVAFHVTLGEPVPLKLRIFDVRGRLVREWGGHVNSAGDRVIEWDFRDRSGRPVPPGLYFARVDAGDIRLTRTVVRME